MKALVLALLVSFYLLSLSHASGACDGSAREGGGRICVIAGGTADLDKTANTAHAKSVSLRTARVLAYEKMAERLEGVVIASQMNISNEILSKGEVKSIVQAKLQNIKVENETVRFLQDGSPWAEVTVSYLPPSFDSSEEVLRFQNGQSHWGEQERDVAGIVLNAQHLAYTPRFHSKIVNESGRVLYESTILSLNRAKNRGMALKSFTQEDRVHDFLGGGDIITIEIVGVSDEGELIVSDQDSVIFVKKEMNHNLLDSNKVVILY